MSASVLKRTKKLEAESATLIRMYAKLRLEIEALEDLILKQLKRRLINETP